MTSSVAEVVTVMSGISSPLRPLPSNVNDDHASLDHVPGDDVADATPPGPYSYVTERRAAETTGTRQQLAHPSADALHGGTKAGTTHAAGGAGIKRAAHWQASEALGKRQRRDRQQGGGERGSRTREGDGGRKARVDARWGQAGAFPEPEYRSPRRGGNGTARGNVREESGSTREESHGNAGGDEGTSNGVDDGEVLTEDDAEEQDRAAWEYLRSVREEAEGLPTFVTGRDVVGRTGNARRGAQRALMDNGADGRHVALPALATGAAEGGSGCSGCHAQMLDGHDERDDHGEYHDGLDDREYQDDDEYGPTLNGRGGAFFSDGAWIAGPTTSHTGPSLPPAQKAYHTALLDRFLAHRTHLQFLVATHAVTDLNRSAHIDFSSSMRHSRPSFVNMRLPYLGPSSACSSLSTAPPPSMLLSGSILHLSRTKILHALSVLESDMDHHLTRGQDLAANLGPWTWTLLGLLDDVGSLTSEEVGVVRDLGKRAAWGLGRYAIVEGLAAGVPGWHARAVVEGVVTIVGEVWGQRDLLDGRPRWDPMRERNE